MAKKKRSDEKALASMQIVVGVIGFVVLVALVYVLVNSNSSGGVNFEEVVSSCQAQCEIESLEGFCGELRSIVFVSGDEPIKLTCDELANPVNRRIINSRGEVESVNVPASGLASCDALLVELCRTATKEAIDNYAS